MVGLIYKKLKRPTPFSLSTLSLSSIEARPLFSPIHNTAPAERNPGTLRCSGQIHSPRTALAMPSLYIPASLCAASYPSPCPMASTGCCKGWPESALLREPAEYATAALPHVSAASSRETANYTSNSATMRSTSPDDNGKLESPPTSSTRNTTTAMSRSSTADLDEEEGSNQTRGMPGPPGYLTAAGGL